MELLAVGENEQWWQPNGSPLAEPPFKLYEERRSQPPPPDFVRRAFVARISGVPLPRRRHELHRRAKLRARQWIGYEDIQKVPTRTYFSGIETVVPAAAAKVTLRWA